MNDKYFLVLAQYFDWRDDKIHYAPMGYAIYAKDDEDAKQKAMLYWQTTSLAREPKIEFDGFFLIVEREYIDSFGRRCVSDCWNENFIRQYPEIYRRYNRVGQYL